MAPGSGVLLGKKFLRLSIYFISNSDIKLVCISLDVKKAEAPQKSTLLFLYIDEVKKLGMIEHVLNNLG